MECVGIDVSKATLSCAFRQQVRVFDNDPKGHRGLLEWASAAQAWCMEATGRYHRDLAAYAVRSGRRCLVVNPGRAKKYLSFVDPRAKTDKVDALALARLAEREGENLRACLPPPPAIERARDVLARRRSLVESRIRLGQTIRTTGDPHGVLARVVESAQAACRELEKELAGILRGYPRYRTLLSIPGIGPLSAALAACAMERGEFPTSDSLVAFAGLDPRAADSGVRKGRRTLSHQGDAQLRTTLYMAARSGARLTAWKPYYAKQLAKGLSTTEATVVLARKMLRTAWSIYRSGVDFRPSGMAGD